MSAHIAYSLRCSYFLREAAKLTHFGTRFFPAELDGRFNPLNLPHNFWIGVSAQGIVLCAEDLVSPSHGSSDIPIANHRRRLCTAFAGATSMRLLVGRLAACATCSSSLAMVRICHASTQLTH